MHETDKIRLLRQYFSKKGLPQQPALTFVDVVILDKFSSIISRSDIGELKTPIVKGVDLNIPIVSANMDSVTDSKMAIAIARLGGLGFIHQFFPLDIRKREVAKVKRADNALIENPVTIHSSATLGEAKELMAGYGISSILVVDNGVLQGILTSRDYRFKDDDNMNVASVMTEAPLITAPPGTEREEAKRLLEENKIEKLPLVDDDGRIKGLITAKDAMKEKAFPYALRDFRGRLRVGVAIRPNSDYVEEVGELLGANADIFLLDTARANSEQIREVVKNIKKKYKISLVVGNIDTPEAAAMLIDAGADGIKVGIGPGSACKTRETAGVGIPQLTALVSCAAVARKYGVPIIADGGIRTPADVAKAIVAGANTVMIGGMFAGTDESPGDLHRDANQQWKVYLGSASLEHQLDRIECGSLEGVRTPEGVPKRVPYTGSVNLVIDELLGGLRSAMSYVGARDLEEFFEKGEFVWQTRAGYEEGKPQV